MLDSVAQVLDGRPVLIVEDEYHLADEMARALRAQGAVVRGPVGNLADARRATGGDEEIDAVVLDLRLHEERTVGVADDLTARGIPFVFLTGYDTSMVPERHRNVPHLEKPCDLGRLVRVLAAFFD